MCPVLFARLYWLVFLRLSSVYLQFPIPTVSVAVSVFLSVKLFSLSQYPLPQCCFSLDVDWLSLVYDQDSCQPSLYFSPVIPGSDLCLLHGPDLDFPLHNCLPAHDSWTVFTTLWFLINRLISPWTWSGDWFLFTSLDTSLFKIPFSLYKSPTLPAPKQPQTITLPPPCLTDGVRHSSSIFSLVLHLTNVLLCDQNTSNLDLSVHNTWVSTWVPVVKEDRDEPRSKALESKQPAKGTTLRIWELEEGRALSPSPHQKRKRGKGRGKQPGFK